MCIICIRSNVHPNQGGKFVGFGNAPAPTATQGDDYWSSLSNVYPHRYHLYSIV